MLLTVLLSKLSLYAFRAKILSSSLDCPRVNVVFILMYSISVHELA